MNFRTTFLAWAYFVVLGVSALAQDRIPRKSKPNDTDIEKGKVVSELDAAIWRIYHASNGDYWFGSKERGVYRYDGKTLVNYSTIGGLNYDAINRIQEDKKGILYFPTTPNSGGRNSQGISQFDGQTFLPMEIPEKSAAADAWMLQPDDLWFGGGGDTGTVLRYDGSTWHRLELPRTHEGEESLKAFPRSKNPNINFSPYDAYFVFKDSKGHIWFATALVGVCRFDGNSFTWIPESELRNGSFGTRSIVEDKAGKFWFCNSMYRYDVLNASGQASFRKEPGIYVSGDATKPRIGGIMSSVVDNSGALWMATYGDGVWRYDGSAVTQYSVKEGKNQINTYSITKDNHGALWLGTQHSGAYKFNGRAFEKFKP